MTSPANQLWFLDSLVTIRVSSSAGQDGLSVLEHQMPYGSSAPFHFHHTEDELLQVLEGEYRVKIRDQEQRFGPGAVLLVPKGVPHTYRVESKSGGRLLSTTVGGEFERFVLALSRPAERPEPPPPAGPPSDDAIQRFKGTAAKFGIEIIGPPLR